MPAASGHPAKHFSFIISFQLPQTTHFTDKETKVQRVGNMTRATQSVSGEARICTRSVGVRSLHIQSTVFSSPMKSSRFEGCINTLWPRRNHHPRWHLQATAVQEATAHLCPVAQILRLARRPAGQEQEERLQRPWARSPALGDRMWTWISRGQGTIPGA